MNLELSSLLDGVNKYSKNKASYDLSESIRKKRDTDPIALSEEQKEQITKKKIKHFLQATSIEKEAIQKDRELFKKMLGETPKNTLEKMAKKLNTLKIDEERKFYPKRPL